MKWVVQLKKVWIFLGVILFFCLAANPARAVELEKEQQAAIKTDELQNAVPDGAEEILKDMEISLDQDYEAYFGRIQDAVSRQIGGIFKDAAKKGVTILTLAALCALVSTLLDGGKTPNYVVLAAVAAVTVTAAGDVNAFLGLGRTVMDDLNAFSKALLPTLTAAAAAGGMTASAAAKYAATSLFMDILITAANTVILPLIYAFVAVSVGAAAFEGSALKNAARFIKWTVTVLLTAIVLIFTTYLSITGVIAGTADAAAAKLAKTVLSASLPVVGSILSDAAGTVVGGMNLLRNAVGAYGLLVVCGVCVLPFLRLGVHYLIFKGTAALTAAVADTRISDLTGAIGTAFGFILGLTGTAALILFISIVSVLKAVTG